MNETLTQQSVNAKQPATVTLPYVALGLARTGRQDEAQHLVDAYRDRVARDFYYLLGEASVQASAGKSDAARDLLWEAFFARLESTDTTIRPDFQLLEVGRGAGRAGLVHGQLFYRVLAFEFTSSDQMLGIWVQVQCERKRQSPVPADDGSIPPENALELLQRHTAIDLLVLGRSLILLEDLTPLLHEFSGLNSSPHCFKT